MFLLSYMLFLPLITATVLLYFLLWTVSLCCCSTEKFCDYLRRCLARESHDATTNTRVSAWQLPSSAIKVQWQVRCSVFVGLKQMFCWMKVLRHGDGEVVQQWLQASYPCEALGMTTACRGCDADLRLREVAMW